MGGGGLHNDEIDSRIKKFRVFLIRLYCRVVNNTRHP